jgi:hypothetical protein
MKKLSYICLVVLLFSACTKDFEELNTNPNQPTTAHVDYLFTESLVRGVGGYGTGVHSEMWTFEVWCQMMADINGINNPGEYYAFSGDWNNELWCEWYADAIAPVNQVVILTQGKPSLVNKNAIARIWRAYLFHRITDLWGDVPYTEALRGVNAEGESIMTPKYDTQQSIYRDLIKELKEASASLDQSIDSYSMADAMYQGDVNKWKRFSNTLCLRLLLRISNADPSFAETEIKALTAQNEFISSNNEGAHFVYNNEFKHYFYEIAVNGQGLRNPSYYFLEMLNTTNDPRVSVYAQKTPSSQVLGTAPYVGVPNLKTSGELGNLGFDVFSTSECGSYFLNLTTPGTTLSYAESCFLQSEAALKGWGTSIDAQQAFKDGIRAHMEFVEVHDTAITNYIQNTTWTASLEQIITQKYITLAYRDAYEAFAEYRRTGFPVLKDYEGNLIPNATYPQRLSYPPSELTLNGNNVSQVGEGIDDMHSKVWWAK